MIADSAGFEVVTLCLQLRAREVSHEEFVDRMAAVVDDVGSRIDVFALLLRIGVIAAGSTSLAAEALDRDPATLMQEAALWYAHSEDGETD